MLLTKLLSWTLEGAKGILVENTDEIEDRSSLQLSTDFPPR